MDSNDTDSAVDSEDFADEEQMENEKTKHSSDPLILARHINAPKNQRKNCIMYPND